MKKAAMDSNHSFSQKAAILRLLNRPAFNEPGRLTPASPLPFYLGCKDIEI
jgi:hypothetical protein